MAKLEKLEFERFGPYKFIGKSVYARTGSKNSGQIFGNLWSMKKWIFEKIDRLADFATSEVNNVALLTGDKYDEEKRLLGYTVGRFMKPDTPVPDEMDFFDIPDMYVAKGWISGKFDYIISNADRLTREAIKQQNKHIEFCNFCAEVYTEDTIPKENSISVLGYYIGYREIP